MEPTSPDQPLAGPTDFLSSLAKWEAVRRPGDAHRLLASLEGSWDVELVFHGGSQRFESAAIAVKRLVHGGRFLVEELTGEIHAPDPAGRMRPEPYAATRLLGFDRYKRAWVGAFLDDQNTSLLTFVGVGAPGSVGRELELFGACDEPMLDLHDTTMKYVLRVESAERHVWEVYAMAAGGQKVFDFAYGRRRGG
jgi:hypothetical protein